MRIWFKLIKENRLLRDTTMTDMSDDTRTHKIFRALDDVCYEFDLGKPVWLDANVEEFKRHAKTALHRTVLWRRLPLIFWKCR